jgi:hypothetical protein
LPPTSISSAVPKDPGCITLCHVTLRGHKPFWQGYPKSLNTIGDHIRKRRLDLKLLQKDISERLGVDETTIYLWEKN